MRLNKKLSITYFISVVLILAASTFAVYYHQTVDASSTLTITSVSPNSGPVTGGGVVTITGSGFMTNQISTGNAHSCALTDDGRVYCWGDNSSGQLGNETVSAPVTPIEVQGLPAGPARAITTGGDSQYGAFTCVIASDGQVYCWGYNGYGQLGINTNTNYTHLPTEPVQGLPAGPVKAISAGNNHACAIASDSKVYCWGHNVDGQLGNGSTADWDAFYPPQLVQGLPAGPVQSISTSASANRTCAIASDGKAYCWGLNDQGQISGSADNVVTVAVAVDTSSLPSGLTIRQISVGWVHTCAIMSDGNAYCWGNNYYGQLGDGTTSYSATPVKVQGLPAGPVKSISASYEYTCAIASDDNAYCWGNNYYGQLGNGKIDDWHIVDGINPMPQLVLDLPDGLAQAIDTGGGSYETPHACAIMNSGDAYCWGSNQAGQLGSSSVPEGGVVATPQLVQGLPPLLAATTVKIGASECSNVTVLSDTQLTCVIPAHAAGAADVAISNLMGTVTMKNGYTYIGAGTTTPPVIPGVPNTGQK